MDLTEAQSQRREELRTALAKVQVALRFDSAYVRDYVLQNQGSVAMVVRRQCESKFLHDYCDFPCGFANAKATQPFTPMPREEWLYHLRLCVLRTIQRDSFPSVWPWLDS
jgi:hypothetical protein